MNELSHEYTGRGTQVSKLKPWQFLTLIQRANWKDFNCCRPQRPISQSQACPPQVNPRAVIVYCLVFSWKRLGSMRTGQKMFSLLLRDFSKLCCAWVGAHTGGTDPQSGSQRCRAAIYLRKYLVHAGDPLVVADGSYSTLNWERISPHYPDVINSEISHS